MTLKQLSPKRSRHGGCRHSIASVVILVVAAVLLWPATPAGAISIQRVVSEKGIEAWLVEDHNVPLMTMRFAFRGGSALDPKGKEGLANMTSSLLDEGAGKLDSMAFQQRLEDNSISINFGASLDNFRGTLRTLTETRAMAFDLLRLAMTRPRFDPEPVERIRSQILSGLARAAERPRHIARRTWMRAVFPDHPYRRPADGTPESIARIKAGDMAGFVKDRLGRDKLVIGVVGDISAKQLAPLLDKTFGPLPAKAKSNHVPEATPAVAGDVFVIKRDIPQSVVLFGHGGIKRDDPDYYATYIMNHILGGSTLNSRLGNEVREKRGLAYSVYSYLSTMDHAGLIMGGVATANESVAKSIEIIRKEWGRMRSGKVSKQELSDAKTYLTGSFFTRLNSTRRISRLLLGMQLEHLGIDYISRRNRLIDGVTAADIRRVAQRLLDPAKLTFIVIGTPKGVKPTREPPPKS
ncbi:MAG: pitrilysin family protein [Alphaproteobacteria bacterium]